MTQRYLLSIDSGGLRGIIPTIALVKLERTTGKLTRDIFSFVAGTSTGALIAAAIAAGVPATSILDFYTNRAKKLFNRSPLNILKLVLLGSRYSTLTLHDLIEEALGPASAWTLNDSPIDILLTAKRISDGMPWYFVRDHPVNSGCTGRLGLVDCTTASAAAPTYFEPWTISETSPPAPCERVGTLVDGAVGVTGNPVYQACIEAFEYTPDYTPGETITVSLGTGKFKHRKEPRWIGAWLEWVMAELLESPGEQQTEITWRHFPQMTFYRIDTELKEDIGMDDTRSIARLLEYGERLAEMIDWDAILAGIETRFRIGSTNTLWEQYKVQVL
jgi:patatin-like phospholipase/acyl hydrolase